MNKPEFFSLNLSSSVLSICTPPLQPLFLSFAIENNFQPEEQQKTISFYECCELELVKKEYTRIRKDLSYKISKNKNSEAKDLLKKLEFNLRKFNSEGRAIYSIDPTNPKLSDQLIQRSGQSLGSLNAASINYIKELDALIDDNWSTITTDQSLEYFPTPTHLSPIQYFKQKQRFYHFELRKKWHKTFDWLFYYWSLGDTWACSILWEQYRPSTLNDLIWSITPHYGEIDFEIDPRIDIEHYMYKKTLDPKLSQEMYLEQWGEKYYENNFNILVPEDLLDQVCMAEDKSIYSYSPTLPRFELVIEQEEQSQTVEQPLVPIASIQSNNVTKKVLFLNLYAYKSVLLNKSHDPVPFFVDLAKTQFSGWQIYVNNPHPIKSKSSKIKSDLEAVSISWDQILEYGYDYFDSVVLSINQAVINNLRNRLNFNKEITSQFPLLVEAINNTKTEVIIPDFGIYYPYDPKLIPGATVVEFDPFIPPFEQGHRPISIWSNNYELISSDLLDPTIDLISNYKVPFNVKGIRSEKNKNCTDARFYWLSEKEPLSRAIEMLGRHGSICLVSQSHRKSALFEQENLEQLVIKTQQDLDTIMKIDPETETELRRKLCSIFL